MLLILYIRNKIYNSGPNNKLHKKKRKKITFQKFISFSNSFGLCHTNHLPKLQLTACRTQSSRATHNYTPCRRSACWSRSFPHETFACHAWWQSIPDTGYHPRTHLRVKTPVNTVQGKRKREEWIHLYFFISYS